MALITKATGPNNTTIVSDNQSRRPGPSTSPSKMPLTFTDLPPEIRVMILKLCDLRFWHRINRGRCSAFTPPIIIALRPQPICYHEVLHLFYQQNHYQLGFLTSFSSKPGHYNPMSTNALLTVDKLGIYVTEDNLCLGTERYAHRQPFKNSPRRLLLPETIDYLFRNGNVQELHLSFTIRACTPKVTKAFLHSFPKWLRAFSKLNRLCVQVPTSEFSAQILGLMQDVGDKATFVRSTGRSEVFAYGRHDYDNLEWIANEGELMDWSGLGLELTTKSKKSFLQKIFGVRKNV